MRWNGTPPSRRWVDWLAGFLAGVAFTLWWLRGT